MTDTRRTIMLIDGDDADRSQLSAALSACCHIILPSADELTIARLRQLEVEAILLELPQGFSLLDSLSADAVLRQIPILAVLNGDDGELKTRALARGVYDLIERPLNAELVQRRVRNLLERQDAVESAKQELSRYDRLTGLLTRQAFVTEARELIRNKPPQSFELFCIDVDNFKIVNDRYGYTEGDRLLRHISDALKAQLMNSEAIVCRDFADEFIFLLPNDGYTFESILPRFLRELRAYVMPVHVTVHVGRYLIDEPETDINLMIDWAKLAQRSIKGSADRTVCAFTKEMRQRMLRQQELVDEMRPALYQGQFVPFFQPQYNYATDEMIGAEALVRWQHPRRGLVFPGEFIPLFEDNGFITEMDKHLWERVCMYLRDWLDRGLDPVPISINISRRDILSLDLPAILEDLTAKYRLSHRLLHLEITESAYTKQPQELVRIVKQLRALGFTVEMDDFGSGYSSLNTLKDVPVDILKLDMKFIRDSEEHSRGGNILSSVVRMAHWLKLPVIAEGVETLLQADYLKSIGCQLMQGHLFDRAMPAGDFEALLSSKAKATERFTVGGTDIKGLADFLDASTQATLLFNSFVGGAAIVEYDRERLECLRANDRFFEEIGYSRRDYLGRSFDLFRSLEASSRELGCAALEEAISTGGETMCELHYIPDRPDRKEFWTNNRIRFLAQNVQNYVFYVAVDNITERKRLEASRADLFNILALIPGGIFKSDPEQTDRVSFISGNLLDMLGCTQQEFSDVYGDRFSNAVYFEDRVRIKEQIPAQLEAGNSSFSFDYRIVTMSGKTKWVFSAGNIVKDSSGHDWVYTVVLDNDSRKRLEEELENKSRQAEALVANASGGIIIRAEPGGETVCEYISEGLSRMLGYEHEELCAMFERSVNAAVYPEDLDRVNAAAAEAVRTLSTFREDYRLVRRDGGIIWINLTGNPVAEKNSTIRFYCSYTDITPRVQSERALRVMAEENEIVIRQSGKYVMRYDIGADRAISLIEASELLGLPAIIDDYVQNLDVRDIVTEDCKAEVLALFEQMRRGVPEGSCELQMRLQGELRWFHADYALICADGRPDHSIISFYETTEQRELEKHRAAQIREKDRLVRILARHSGKFVVMYDYATDTFKPFDETVNVVSNVLPLYTQPSDYLTRGDIAPESVPDVEDALDGLRQGRSDIAFRFKAKAGDGSWKWLDAYISAVSDETGRPGYAIASFEDITDSYEKELAYQRYLRIMSSYGPESQFYLDYNLTRDALESYSHKTDEPELIREAEKGFTEFVKLLTRSLVYAPDRGDFFAFFNRSRLLRAFAHGTSGGEHVFRLQRRETDRPLYMSGRYLMVTDPYSADIRILLTYENIDAAKRAELELIDRAENDAVTHVLNRATLVRRINASLREQSVSELSAFVMLDVDRFKMVNDTLGHLEGDSLLHDIAHTLRSVVFKEDLVGRLGGDEFGIFFGGFPDRRALEKKLTLIMNAVFRELKKDLSISVSAGVALYPGDGQSFAELYAKADAALFQAKGGGKNRYEFYTEEMARVEHNTLVSPIDDIMR